MISASSPDPGQFMSVEEAAAMEDPDVFTVHDYRGPTEYGSWCGLCNLPSAALVERVAWCVNADGVCPVVIAAWLFCTEHDGFTEVAR